MSGRRGGRLVEAALRPPRPARRSRFARAEAPAGRFLWRKSGISVLQALRCTRPMEPDPPSSRPTFQPAGAGMLLAAAPAASVGVGALVGWAAGSIAYGVLGGSVVGVPAGIV